MFSKHIYSVRAEMTSLLRDLGSGVECHVTLEARWRWHSSLKIGSAPNIIFIPKPVTVITNLSRAYVLAGEIDEITISVHGTFTMLNNNTFDFLPVCTWVSIHSYLSVFSSFNCPPLQC